MKQTPLTCPKCQGEMWFDTLTTLRKLEGRIISFIDQPELNELPRSKLTGYQNKSRITCSIVTPACL